MYIYLLLFIEIVAFVEQLFFSLNNIYEGLFYIHIEYCLILFNGHVIFYYMDIPSLCHNLSNTSSK